MSNSQNDNTIHEGGSAEASDSGSGPEQEHAGNSGEGAASALAHLKTQTRQHRRLSGGESDDPAGGHAQ